MRPLPPVQRHRRGSSVALCATHRCRRTRCCGCACRVATRVLRFVADVDELRVPAGGRRARPARWTSPPRSVGHRRRDRRGDARASTTAHGRVERHEGLGLGAAHPRWIASVLCADSELRLPGCDRRPRWMPRRSTRPLSPRARRGDFSAVDDRYGDIVPDDFFDDGLGARRRRRRRPACTRWSTVDGRVHGRGPGSLPAGSAAGARRRSWTRRRSPARRSRRALTLRARRSRRLAAPELDGLRLDPRHPDDLDADRRATSSDSSTSRRPPGRSSLLLDVPPGLDQRQILTWRAQFATSYAAAYHPWLDVARVDDGGATRWSRVQPVRVRRRDHRAPRARCSACRTGPRTSSPRASSTSPTTCRPRATTSCTRPAINVFLRERDGDRADGGAHALARPGVPPAQRAAADDDARAHARAASCSGWCSSRTTRRCAADLRRMLAPSCAGSTARTRSRARPRTRRSSSAATTTLNTQRSDGRGPAGRARSASRRRSRSSSSSLRLARDGDGTLLGGGRPVSSTARRSSAHSASRSRSPEPLRRGGRRGRRDAEPGRAGPCSPTAAFQECTRARDRAGRAGAAGGRPQRRRHPPRRPGEVPAARPQARDVLRRRRRRSTATLWDWLQDVVSGVRPVVATTASIEVIERRRRRWSRAGCSTAACRRRSSGPQLNAQDGRDRDRGAAHRARGPAAGGGLMPSLAEGDAARS